MTSTKGHEVAVQELDRVTIRFAGDSGDGMQLTGTQFTRAAAVFGNDISTLPDYPAEIRAPAGSLPGVSGFQISFSSSDIHTPGDAPDVLVAMNPAALRTNVKDLVPGGAIIVNGDAFTPNNLTKAGYATNPLTDGSLKPYTVFEIPVSTLNARALEGLEMTSKQVDLTKNFFALGVMFWLFERSMEPTLRWIEEKFGSRPVVAEANRRALHAGYAFGETTEIFHTRYLVPAAHLAPGTYRNVTGNEATALGCVAASALAGRPLVYSTYPITPATDILHQLSGYKSYGIKTFQAEDEIAAIGAALGASYGGALGLTGTSGPGMALKAEMLGLAVMVELPLVVVNVQRGGPSTGLPTKTEQSDLLQALYGRNGESPLPVVAPASPGGVLRHGDRGLADRPEVHDARSSTSPTRSWPTAPSRGWSRTSPTCPTSTSPTGRTAAGFYPYHRDERDAGPAVGRARHAGPRAPHRRPREARRPRHGQLRPRQPPPDVAPARREGGPDRRRHRAARGLRAARGRPAHPRAGAPPTARSAARWSGSRRAARRSPTRTCATCTRSRRTPATSSGPTARC